MDHFNLEQIAPRLGGKQETFEELCCQLARRSVPEDSAFTRLYGGGGDGGVECFATSHGDVRVGWQAKYVFDIGNLLSQATASIQAALKVHGSLRKWVLCFPFDLTGPTGRKGQSGAQKLAAWKRKQELNAKRAGRDITIEFWPKSKLLSELLRVDTSGGIRAFFFDSTVLSNTWFRQHLDAALEDAGPRYSRTLRVDTSLWKWFSALGRTESWATTFAHLTQACRKQLADLKAMVIRRQESPLDPPWPEPCRSVGEACLEHVQELLATSSDPVANNVSGQRNRAAAVTFQDALVRCASELSELETSLKEDLEAKHGSGTADSVGFRQFMAEYQVSFPMASLDSVRELKKSLEGLGAWLKSPEGWAAFERTLLVTGAAGAGKTDGICDAAVRRLEQGRLSLVLFGHQFKGDPDPWTRVREQLGLSPNLTRDGMLDALNSAAEASGHVMILWIDAINETKPLRYWRDRLGSFSEAIGRWPFLRLCIACRTSYVEYCVPSFLGWYRAEHKGFSGNEITAVNAFFRHYGLEVPVTPIFQPEFANPLFLMLVCETLKAKGLKKLPPGWIGLATAIRAFLDQKNSEFAVEHEILKGIQVVPRGLQAIAREIANQGDVALTWSAADRLIRSVVAIAPTLKPVEWLVRENLLIEDVPELGSAIEPESVVRPAFERLGDFLIAWELLSDIRPEDLIIACQVGGRLHSFIGAPDLIARNEGLVSALSILIPEQLAKGIELADLFDDGPTRVAIVKATIRSFPWRDPMSFSASSQTLLRTALRIRGFAAEAMDAALSVSCQPSAIDAFWLRALFATLQMARRDAFWCTYLNDSYEAEGAVKRLIDSARQLPTGEQVEKDVAERWITALLCMTGAADRRVKDNASRAAMALLRQHPNLAPNCISGMFSIDDDVVCETTLLAAYGVSILSRDRSAIAAACQATAEELAKNPQRFHNALLRDHARCLAELALLLGIKDPPKKLIPLLDRLKSPWPLEVPSDEEIKAWDKLPKLVDSCLDDDFFVYTLNCLNDWSHTVPKTDMGKWILRRIVSDFRYAGSGCEAYDWRMLKLHGGGRSKPTWAERIGKKYQWISLYQLAARLSDHVARDRKRSSRPKPLRKPLVLLEERQLDLTLPPEISEERRDGDSWWIPASVKLDAFANLTDSQWVEKTDDIPRFPNLLEATANRGSDWLLLNGHPSWNNRPANYDMTRPYRNIWLQIRGYVVEPESCDKAFSALAGRNFFGRWMPEGAQWLYGFAGEYPWGPAFNTEQESYHSRGDSAGLPCEFIPVCSEVVAEWQYDASLSRYAYVHVPARVFFQPGDLWWNGKDGYVNTVGETVFRAPDITEAGPSALIANRKDLLNRVRAIKKRLIWTLLGEKWILGGPDNRQYPHCTFSQVAMLEEDGSIRYSDLAFFDKRTGTSQVAYQSLSRAGHKVPRNMAAAKQQTKSPQSRAQTFHPRSANPAKQRTPTRKHKRPKRKDPQR